MPASSYVSKVTPMRLPAHSPLRVRRVQAWGCVAVMATLGCAGAAGGHADAGASDDAGQSDPFQISSSVPDQHRPTEVTCDHSRPSTVPDGGYGFPPGNCESDAECADGGADGRCTVNPGAGSICTYDQCFTDSDCADGGICSCRDYQGYQINACVPGNCHVDADCGDGGYCSPVEGGCPPFVGILGYYCHTPKDECVNDSDCSSVVPGLYCIYDPTVETRWFCAPIDCTG